VGRATVEENTENTYELDVMVLLSNEAIAYLGDLDAALAFVHMGVQMGNDAYAASGIHMRMRLDKSICINTIVLPSILYTTTTNTITITH